MHELAHEFTNRKVSPWGGIKYFHKTYIQSELRDFLLDLDLPKPGSNRGFQSIDLVEGFMTSVVLGSRRLAHTGMLRTDDVIKEIFGWKKGMASESTFSRFFKKFTVEKNNVLFPSIFKFWFEQMAIKKMTVDIDSTVITRYGNQELAAKGYNPEKRGRSSHHPLIAFCEEMKMVLNGWMRSGDSHSNTDMIDFLDELFQIIDTSRIGLMRLDSGFYSDQIMSKLEAQINPVNYIVRAKMTSKLKREISQITDWYSNNKVSKRTCYSEIQYKATKWSDSRRMIVVRTKIKNESSKEAYLFKEENDFATYEYKAFVTTCNQSPTQIHSLYNQRGECENRIKELKYDYGIDGFALQSFGAMEAAFRFVLMAYNIMSLFRQKVLISPKAHRLSTLKFQCIAIGSYLITKGRKKVMKLSAEGRRRHFLEHIFENVEQLKPPFHISNA